MSDEVVASNSALSPVLSGFLHHGRLPPDWEEVLKQANLLQAVASFLLCSTKVYKQQRRRGGVRQAEEDDLQPRICAASVANLDTRALLFDFAGAGEVADTLQDVAYASLGQDSLDVSMEYRRGLERMVDYLDGMRYAGWRGGGLERLRATTHSPAAILASLRQVLQEPPSIAERGPCLCVVRASHLPRRSGYLNELRSPLPNEMQRAGSASSRSSSATTLSLPRSGARWRRTRSS